MNCVYYLNCFTGILPLGAALHWNWILFKLMNPFACMILGPSDSWFGFLVVDLKVCDLVDVKLGP